ncbi:MAG TPA: thiamine pyrophosphate-binding protein [candidate division Zixibacteria bacterium]|nr:thiamine pyrophosphate-binding protein [candidate division Zixibacteria bacterium]
MARQRGAQSLVRALEAHGVEYIFGLPGHGNMNILDAIYDSNQISFKLVRHEQAAAHIADGYARISGEVGVCCSSVGPGAANMIMGIATAYFTSSPILAISGGIITKQAGRGQLQETSRAETPTDQGYMQALQPFTKKVWDIQQPVRTGEIVRKAFAIAQADRPGPVAIEYPWDLQAEYVDEVDIQVPEKYAYGRGVRADKTALQKAADYLCQADCPVIVAGNGAMIGEAGPEVVELAELIGAPVATSFVAKGIIPEDHPLSIGMVGWLGHPVAHEMIREHADIVFAIGYRFSDEATSWWTEGRPYVKENRFIQLDIQQQELAKNYPVEVGLLGDAKASLRELIDLIRDRGGRPGYEKSSQWIFDVTRAFHLDLPDAEKTPMESMVIADRLRALLPRDSILSIDTGTHAHYFSAFYPIFGPRRFLNPGGWTPMGWGPAAILGAKLAAPDKVCVSISGDGGFLMVCQEIVTAVEWNVPVIWLVFNDQALRAIRDGQKEAYEGRIIGTEFTQPTDFAAMARSMGALGIRVTHVDELSGAIDQAISYNRPCVIDLQVDQEAIYPPVAGIWYEPARSPDARMPRGSSRQWT